MPKPRRLNCHLTWICIDLQACSDIWKTSKMRWKPCHSIAWTWTIKSSVEWCNNCFVGTNSSWMIVKEITLMGAVQYYSPSMPGFDCLQNIHRVDKFSKTDSLVLQIHAIHSTRPSPLGLFPCVCLVCFTFWVFLPNQSLSLSSNSLPYRNSFWSSK
jgi:hypothetical protein